MSDTTKVITIRAKTKTVEPKLYTMTFLIGELKYYRFQKMAYSLEDAVKKCTLNSEFNYRTPHPDELHIVLEMTLSEIKQQLKNL